MSSHPPQRHRNLVGTVVADGRLLLESVLGIGAYGVVYLARDLSQRPSSLHGPAKPTHYAVKCLNKVGLDARQRAFQRREILLHTMTSSHPNVLTLHRVIDNPSDPYVYVILDYCPDGDLFSMITEKQRFLLAPEPFVKDPSAADGRPVPEDKAYTKARYDMDMLIKDVYDQILAAVEYCHSLGIYHRDLKPENILCADGGRRVYLADFGLATGDRMSSDFGCGSSFYMGPECQGGITTRLTHYSPATNDVWSLGVILINFICGRNPWKQATPNDDTFHEFLRDPDFIQKILPVSDDVHAILKRIFTLRPENRCSVSDIRKWIRAAPRLQASNMDIWQRKVLHSSPIRRWDTKSPPTPTYVSAAPSPHVDVESKFSMLSIHPPHAPHNTSTKPALNTGVACEVLDPSLAYTPNVPPVLDKSPPPVQAATPTPLHPVALLPTIKPGSIASRRYRHSPGMASHMDMSDSVGYHQVPSIWSLSGISSESLSTAERGNTPFCSPPSLEPTSPDPPMSPMIPQMPGSIYPLEAQPVSTSQHSLPT